MEQIKNNYNSINKVVNGYRSFALIVVTSSLVLVLFLCFMIYQVSNNKLLVVDGQGDILSASKSSEDAVFKIEADNHIRLFYARFFSYDKTNYKQRVELGLALSGKSAITLYETLKAKGWYDKIINNDLMIESYVQTIQFYQQDGKDYFQTKGFQKVIRGDITELRNLDLKGSISKNSSGRVLETNPHGLIIDDIAILDNSVVTATPK
ncbi:hypothetical protein B0A67_23985 [Flavobacterium aquidurense]|uniref:hypothetical protein n=1 Tax=Flavobacterium aquidurense TaxID=362413 RepID=UPI0009234BD5|nr:hypothetical protein [Flavobacterium aquidurense]OXA65945.1 hypothetical protein B0A67_23985 [Flavobacterium aquidurense]SHH85278.1 hypothetical protein SAMN05444481_13427 [Flavobacterium frigidimaris]